MRNILKDKVYFEQAISISKLSRDERNKVGAIIVDTEGKIVSSGYNGPSSRIDDSKIDFFGNEMTRKLILTDGIIKLINIKIFDFDYKYNDSLKCYKDIKLTKRSLMLHAETNAIITVDDRRRLNGATIYVTLFPCNNCANLISQVGIKTIKSLNNFSDKYKDTLNESFYIIQESNIDLQVFSKEELNITG